MHQNDMFLIRLMLIMCTYSKRRIYKYVLLKIPIFKSQWFLRSLLEQNFMHRSILIQAPLNGMQINRLNSNE